MEIIAKVSKGTNMDQIYLSKNRVGLAIGKYVIVKPIEEETEISKSKSYFYNVKNLEKIKIMIIEKIMNIINRISVENIIITGSFLEFGFNFNDIDIIIIKEGKLDYEDISQKIKEEIGIKSHIIVMNKKSLIKGVSTDPLYSMMLSKFISKNRIIIKTNREIIPQLLDLHLLKSKTMMNNFDLLIGAEKYYLTKNMISILLFIENKKLSNLEVNKKIEEIFKIKIRDLMENLVEKNTFIEIYKKVYNQIQKEIDKYVR